MNQTIEVTVTDRREPQKGEVRELWIINDWAVEHIPAARFSGLYWTANVNGRNRRWNQFAVKYSREEAAERLRATAVYYQARAERCLKAAEQVLAVFR